MPGEILLPEEGLVALGALHGLLALVHELDVGGEPRPPVEGTIAVGTRERVLARVVEDVRPELRRLDERLPTELAHVRLLPRVRAHVPVQRLLRRESVVALQIANTQQNSLFIKKLDTSLKIVLW